MFLKNQEHSTYNYQKEKNSVKLIFLLVNSQLWSVHIFLRHVSNTCDRSFRFLFLLYHLVHFISENGRSTSLNFNWPWFQKSRAGLNFRSVFNWTWRRIRSRFRRDLILLFIFVTYTIHHLHFILFLLETKKTEKKFREIKNKLRNVY